jgi:PAS domain S-box-containing protein
VSDGERSRASRLEHTPGAGVRIEDASFLRAVLEAIPAYVMRIDRERRIRYVNHVAYGLVPEQVVGSPVHEFIAPEDIEAYDRAVEQALRTGRPCAYVARGRRGARERTYEGHAIPIQDEHGHRDVCVVASDVTEHVARAEALQRSEEKLRVAVEGTGIGLWTWDAVQDVIDCDDRMVEITGQRVQSSREYVQRVVHPDDRAHIAWKLDVTGVRGDFQVHRIVRPDGEVRWVLPCGTLHRDAGGRVVRMTGGTLDVTEQRKVDEHLRHAQKLDAVGSLSAGVAHNFNNMLAVIVPALEIALRGAAGDRRTLLDDALHAALDARDLVKQLMTFSGQRRALTLAPRDLASIVARAVSMCERTFEQRVRIETSLEAGCSASCDPAQIEQVVVTLLINARDAALAGGRADPRVRVILSHVSVAPPHTPGAPPQRYACIRVEDDGVGMTEAVKQRAFDPFFTTKPPGQGTGLGLATSYGIARDHGGCVILESEAGVGTRVSVLLPAASGAVPGAPVAAWPPPQVSAPRRGTILVIDDDPALRRTVEVLLRAQGHQVRVAEDGAAAVAALDAGLRPDLILLDRSMPSWPLSDTLEAVRRRLPAVPVLLFTGQDVPADERTRVQEVLHKPVSVAALEGSVQRWLAAAR